MSFIQLHEDAQSYYLNTDHIVGFTRGSDGRYTHVVTSNGQIEVADEAPLAILKAIQNG